MKVHELPEFDIMDETLIKRFTEELKKAKNSIDQLTEFIDRWKVIWEVSSGIAGDTVCKIDDEIVAKNITDEVLECLESSFKTNEDGSIGVECKHAKTDLCIGMEIRMPWSLLTASRIADYFGVPVSTAFHQAFCKDDHSHCF